MANPIIPNLQHLLVLRNQHQGSAAGTEYPNPITPPPTPTPTTTLAFRALKAKARAPRKNPNPNPNPIATTAAGIIIPPCTECGKRFSSWKALFGHMRCHPERQWRGINPPAHFRRPGPCPVSLEARHYFSSEEYEVASSLILLASGRGRNIGPNASRSIDGPVGWAQHHQCSVCLRGFSSGPALGGHMRCHWDWDHSSAAALYGCCSGGREFELDLNLPPPLSPPPPTPTSSAGGGGVDDGRVSSVLDLRLGM